MAPSMTPERPTAASGLQAGFTLLELLVALVLVALVSVILMGGIRFGSRVWEASQVQTESVNEVYAIRRFLRERTLAARPARSIDSTSGETEANFSGNAGALRLVTLMPAYVARGGLYHLELASAAGSKLSAMALKWWPYGGAETGPGSGQRLLLDGVEDIRISYFGASDNTGAMDWHDDWHVPGELPRLVSIKVAFPAGDPRVWPELIVALPTATGRSNARSRN